MISDHREDSKGSVKLREGTKKVVPSCLPEELVKVSVLHVFKDHDEWVTVTTHPIELDNMLVLQVSEQLSLSLEILPGSQGGILQGLRTTHNISL